MSTLEKPCVAGDLVVEDPDGAFLVFETWKPPLAATTAYMLLVAAQVALVEALRR